MSKGIFLPFDKLSPGNYQVPNGTAPTIDWTHPLTRNLFGCWLGGYQNANVDITGNWPNSSSTCVPFTTSEGVAADGTVAGAGFGAPTAATVPPEAIPPNWHGGCTLWWHGYNTGSTTGQTANPPLIAITWATPNASPFWVMGVNISNPNNVFIVYNSSTGSAGSDSTGFNSFSLVFISSTGNLTAYNNTTSVLINNGISLTNGGGGLSAFNRGGQYNHIACMWSRNLSAAEISWLQYDPYAFILPAENE